MCHVCFVLCVMCVLCCVLCIVCCVLCIVLCIVYCVLCVVCCVYIKYNVLKEIFGYDRDFLWPSGRPHECLSIRSDLSHNFANLRLKAHIQHPDGIQSEIKKNKFVGGGGETYLSASSNTRYVTRFRSVYPFWSKSIKRPGVAIASSAIYR